MSERIIHNGQILTPIEGILDEPMPEVTQPIKNPRAPVIEDIEPDKLAALMAGIISAAMEESPPPTPMEIVNRLLRLKSERGHKVVWTRFDISQLFAIYSNKLDA